MRWDNWCFHTHSSFRVIVPLVFSPQASRFFLVFCFCLLDLLSYCWKKVGQQSQIAVSAGADTNPLIKRWDSGGMRLGSLCGPQRNNGEGAHKCCSRSFRQRWHPHPNGGRRRPLVPRKLFVHREGKKEVKSRSGNAVRTWERAALESWL